MSPRKIKPTEIGKGAIIIRNDFGQFPIVGIGASAGGLEALELFFKNMPKNTGMAFVVIQHLDPNHIGFMPELLQRITTMKVYQATDRLKVKPNCVYVIPPNKSMSLLNGILYLFAPVESRGLRLPIDTFLRSLAADRQEKSIGIILSGMGSDGMMGLKAIKEKNGIVLVQDPATAKFDGMPRSATENVIADIVAPPEELPGKLIAFLKFIPASIKDDLIENKQKSNIEKIIILLREQSGHDFSLYKKNTLFRRIERRKGIHQIDKISSYVRFLQENPMECEILFKELLIGVTNFFRDISVWEMLKEKILPSLINELPEGYAVRAWVTGCSTGEEAYSLAIVFQEVLENLEKRKNLTLQIFATDIDDEAIEKARKGYFPKSIMADISPSRLNRFFTVEAEGYRVNATIREMIVFAPQNVIRDPPFTKIDILTCRNMLIYMEPELQKKLMALFNFSLNPGGILILGTAESAGTPNEGFDEDVAGLKIFKRTAIRPVTLTDFPSSFHHSKDETTDNILPSRANESIQTLADQVLLQRFSPASVLVNKNGDILYITGRTGKYLEPVAGKANWNIHAMTRDGLRDVIPNAFRKAMQSYDAIVIQNIKVGTNGGTQLVDITVQRIENPSALRGMVMIVFTDKAPIGKNERINLKTGKRSIATEEYKELESELQRYKEDLQSTREEMQTSQEELKSTNEELQSTNEELQSTNEEITTSKEEMQSLNEELQTVNIELQTKVNDFTQINNDMKNMLNSTDIATLFLDKELNIRNFTIPVTRIFNLRKQDIGRPFTDLVSNLQYSDIDIHSRKVIETLTSIESINSTRDGRWFNVKIMPYRTLDDRIDGVVLTFIDITEIKKLEIELKNSNDALQLREKNLLAENSYRRLFESARDGILILDIGSGKIVDVNPFLVELLGYSREQMIEKTIWGIGLFKDIIANKRKFIELKKKEISRYRNLPLETADGRTISVEFISTVYVVDDQKVIQCIIRDMTEYMKTEDTRKGGEKQKNPGQ
jgi:two-component system, chemotaxis family, CheB/CheR fusion protein